MAYARNRIDGRRVYFEDDDGDGVPVVLHGGIVDSVDPVRQSPIARSLPDKEFRRIYVDHRGVGRSDKPHDVAEYAMVLRVADAVAVLDALGLGRAHFVGNSWGGRLGFGIGEHAPDRVLSLVLGGQQPYAINPEGPLARVVTQALAVSRRNGSLHPFVEALEEFSGLILPESLRESYLANDAMAIEAAWRSALSEGAVSTTLQAWRLPCLIFAAVGDVDFHDQARRAAEEIPRARFISVGERDHLEAHHQHDPVLPAVLEMLRAQS